MLVVCDEAAARRTVLEVLAGLAAHGTVVRDSAVAARRAADGGWDLVLADVDALAGETGAFVGAVRSSAPETPVVALVGGSDVERALSALRAGCDEICCKPVNREGLAELLSRLMPNVPVPMTAAAQQGPRRMYEIVGGSRGLHQTVELARKVARTSLSVLIAGESGTGKELVSCLIHHESRRSQGPYVRVNCAAVSESLLESELFGHERGAFTGAIARRIGRFERAHGGTLLLDEISETGPRLQSELLRVLETQDFERLGSSESISVNFRLISTTNRDLRKEVAEGRFRKDLYYRITGVQLTMPSLRERTEDLPALAWYFVQQFARESPRRVTALDEGMMERFARYSWPGNVRQLRNVVRAALLLGSGPVVRLEDVPGVWASLMPPETPEEETLSLQELERRAVLEALRRTDRHYARAADLLGITDRTLREKLRRYRRDGQLEEDPIWATSTT